MQKESELTKLRDIVLQVDPQWRRIGSVERLWRFCVRSVIESMAKRFEERSTSSTSGTIDQAYEQCDGNGTSARVSQRICCGLYSFHKMKNDIPANMHQDSLSLFGIRLFSPAPVPQPIEVTHTRTNPISFFLIKESSDLPPYYFGLFDTCTFDLFLV